MQDILDSGSWYEDCGILYLDTKELGLPKASVSDDSEATKLLLEHLRGQLKLPAPTEVSLTDIHVSVQGVLRKDALQFYMSGADGYFSGEASSWEADGPLAVELADGRVALVDGNHRWASARIRNESSFVAQILRKSPAFAS